MLDARLRERGWPTILSMRMIPAVPFSVLNYAAGASAVRVVPYTLASFVGLLPGTAAVVILGDALTGNVSPLLFLVSLCTASLGVAGLVYEIRTHRRHHRQHTAEQAARNPPSRPDRRPLHRHSSRTAARKVDAAAQFRTRSPAPGRANADRKHEVHGQHERGQPGQRRETGTPTAGRPPTPP